VQDEVKVLNNRLGIGEREESHEPSDSLFGVKALAKKCKYCNVIDPV
jgi:hypothetical protein